MIEVTGNLWDYPADARVITTNGFVKNNGMAVMGRGCAKEAAQKYGSDLPRTLGARIQGNGNIVTFYSQYDNLITFPVKHNWYESADTALIAKSTLQLLELTDEKKFRKVVMPRPGCGNGGLWWGDVKPILEEILDDRFYVITFKHDPPRDPSN